MNAFLGKSVVGEISKFLFLSLFCCLFVGSVSAQFVLTGGNWSNATNWEGGVVPPNPFNGTSITVTGTAIVNVTNWELGNGATMTINDGVSLIFDNGNNNTFTNKGIIENNGDISIPGNNNTFNNEGTLNNNGQLSNSNTVAFNNLGTLNIGSSGTYTNSDQFINTATGTINNFGNISTGNGVNMDNFIIRGALNNNGTIIRTDGDITFEGDLVSISGSGTIDMNGDSQPLSIPSGTLSPGNSFGTMTITGSMSLASGVTLLLEIVGGATPGNDLINVSGTLNLAGCSIIVSRTSGQFDDGDNWDLITAGTLNGPIALPPTLPVASDVPVNPGDPEPIGTFNFTLTAGASGTFNVSYTGDSFLPIELASFSGEAVDNTIELNWSTANELNNDYMIVERSADGLDFSDVGRVDGKGTTSEAQSYSFLDQAPLNGLNYYRLRQVDFDGTENYSNVIVIDMEMEIDGIQLHAFPNPSQNQVQVVWQSSTTADDGTIHLIEGTTGRILQRFAMPEGTNRLDIPVQDLPSGMYVIQVVQADQRKAIQFMKN